MYEEIPFTTHLNHIVSSSFSASHLLSIIHLYQRQHVMKKLPLILILSLAGCFGVYSFKPVSSMKRYFILLFVMVFVSSCTVTVTPRLDSSLGRDAFTNMGKIDLREAAIALYIEPKLSELKVNQEIKMGKFSFDIGNAFSVKLIKALSYTFRTIYFIEKPNYTGSDTVDAIMRISLHDVDVSSDVKTGFWKVSTDSYTRLSIRAEIYDIEKKKTVWVGTTQAKETGAHEEWAQMTYQEAGRGFAESINKAIDRAIGELIKQMGKSSNLRLYLDKVEQQRKGA